MTPCTRLRSRNLQVANLGGGLTRRLKPGVEGIHYYTLNKAHSTTRILQNLGLA
ncbi:MAG: hypothetical protein EB034_24460 [Verrucomicrobia bacterium]|nr:hypothetical protein [Verrucomicrobiota bacterium]